MEEACIRHRNVIGLAANGEGDDVTPRYDGTEILEAYKLERRGGEVDNGTPLSGSGGKIEMAKVSGGDTGKGKIAIVRRRVEKVILYALSSRLVQSLADFADRVRLAIAALGSEDVIRIRASPKRSRHHMNN